MAANGCANLADGTQLEADICIIGAGPAGLMLASSLDRTPARVIVIEAGGPPGPPRGLDTPAADMLESDFGSPLSVPTRFGGGANEWIVRLPMMRRGVRMVPLSPEDLEARDWVPHSGWPIGWDELTPYYAQAIRRLGLSDRGFALDRWTDTRHSALDLEASGFTTAIELMADPRIFTRQIRRQLDDSSNVDVYLGARAGTLDGAADRATTLSIDHGRRDRLSVTANTFVLATGGVENARLLLGARDRSGFGESRDLVGRYYIDHHRIVAGELTPANPRCFEETALYDLTTIDGSHVMGKLIPTAQTRRDHHLLHSAAMLLPKPSGDIEAGLANLRSLRRSPTAALRTPARSARAIWYSARTGIEMAARQRRVPPRIDAGWSPLSRNRARFTTFSVETQIELAPDPDNRIRLGDRTDEFGRPGVEMTWRWTDHDLDSVRRTNELLERAFLDRSIGTFEPSDWDEDPPLTTPNGGFHPSGTTRMSATPATGVVDADGRVHGVANLYVTGSSTFPTAGYANPTLTIVALALRLADRLEREIPRR